jgi:hypothetical protein
MIIQYSIEDGAIALAAPAIAASSETGRKVDQIIEEGLRHLKQPRIDVLESEIEQVMQESTRDTAPVDAATKDAAVQFAYLLPYSLPMPEISPDPDGEIMFDWLGPSGKMFSVSIDKTGRIAYAGRFGDKSKVHGIEQLSLACPYEVIRGIAKAIC